VISPNISASEKGSQQRRHAIRLATQKKDERLEINTDLSSFKSAQQRVHRTLFLSAKEDHAFIEFP